METNPGIPESLSLEASQYPCLCALVRKAGRVLTRRYDEYLKPGGVRITQFSMLINISRNQSITVSQLAKLLVMDQTTVSRNLHILEKSGYIYTKCEMTDQRIKKILVTDAGMSKINEAKPLWEKAQSEMKNVLGEQGIQDLLDSLAKISL